MSRESVIRLLAVLGLVLGGWWLEANTEWVEKDIQRGAQGEALHNPVYAFEQLLRRLNMHVEHHEVLDALPPAQGRLLLLSNDWSLIPARAEAVHQWVLHGGHLVLLQELDWDETPLKNWVQVYPVQVSPEERKAESAASAASAASAVSVAPAASVARHDGVELAASPPLWGQTDKIRVCWVLREQERLRAKPGQTPEWILTRSGERAEALRLPVGQGSVTVLNSFPGSFYNDAVLRCDNAQLLAAIVQAEPGATLWIYLNERRESLAVWLWQRGWIAILAGLLALAAALWRGSVRFGPLTPLPSRLRRSIAEQVRGTGAYLWREGREALLHAQQRALEEAAARQLRGYLRLKPEDRARAIAAATQLAPDAVILAMQTQGCTRAELPACLQMLESARRLLERRQGPKP